MPKISRPKFVLALTAFLYVITWVIVVPKTHEKFLNGFFDGINSPISKPQGYALLLPEVKFKTIVRKEYSGYSSSGEMLYYAKVFTILPFVVHYSLLRNPSVYFIKKQEFHFYGLVALNI